MTLGDVVNKIITKRWTKINNFSISLNLPGGGFRNSCKWDITDDDLNLSLKSIDTPQYSNNPIEYFTGNEWRFNNGRDDMFRFTMTFRDYDQMKLYSSFVNMYNKAKDNYFDNIKLDITIYIESDVGVSKTLLLTASDSIIESISQIQFDHTTENQIAEFTVNFKCSSPVHKGITSNTSIGGLLSSVGISRSLDSLGTDSGTDTTSTTSNNVSDSFTSRETDAERTARVNKQAQAERDLQYNVSSDGELTLK